MVKVFFELERERERVLGLLTETGRELENHLKTAHGGKPMTTCHRCINLELGIRSDRETLEDIRRRLGK